LNIKIFVVIVQVLQKWRNRLKDAPLETDCNQIKLCLQIGLKCFKVDRNERPTAKEIIGCLDGWERRNSVDKHKLEENTNSVDNNADALPVPDPAADKVLSLSRGREGNSARPVIPDDFRCPISLDLMNDPVIVATGQVILLSNIQFKCFHPIYRPFAFQLTIIPCICLCRLMSGGT